MEHVRHRHREQHSTLVRQPANANSWESNPRMELSRELEEIRRELAREKNLTKRFLNEEQETRRKLEEAKEKLARKVKWNELSITKEKDMQDEFESLKRTCDPESMNTFEIATEVRNNIKRTMKKELHHEFEQLKVASSINQEYFDQKIQFERRNNAALQQELEQLRGPSFQPELWI
ncbi:Cilia- and flagella-associated protein 157 [Dissostichus eleginoides]|uniref:Cilia- and flagella-associated protein 157 n=1 Tax=Dissostichus eleginoides TaxID=100907 RepID=A0AAD9BVY5_DISEL|nr:Cilia- and flagella-associated protein 157 [Dissostichus eleginoides]